jgi:hypothetical protein
MALIRFKLVLILMMKISHILTYFSLIFFMTACVKPSSESYVGPSGKTISSVKCTSSPKGCFVEANKICKGSYAVISSESHAGGLIADIIPGPVKWYGMTFQCGKPNGKQPKFPFEGQRYDAAADIRALGNAMETAGRNQRESDTEQRLQSLETGLAFDCLKDGGVRVGNTCMK